jgi:hypothetical protein
MTYVVFVGVIAFFAGGGVTVAALSVIARQVDGRDERTFRSFKRAKWSPS